MNGISVIIGPMFSGKTTELLRQLSIYSELDMKVLYINTTLDTRGDVFSSHNPLIKNLGKLKGLKISNLQDLIEESKDYDIIGIDEAQMFKNLYEIVLTLCEKFNKKVIVAGLSGDYNRNLFGDIYKLIPVCDEIKKLSAYCKLCISKKQIVEAHFSKRLKNISDVQILVGSSDVYIPVCRKCFNN